MPPQPIKNYVPVIDTLHLNLTKDLAPNAFVLTSHNPTDLLSVNRHNAEALYHSDGYSLERVEQRNQHFHLVYTAKVNGNAFGTLYLDRKSPFGNQQHLIPFHLYNSTLYTEWVPTLTNFMAAFELTISTFAQVHIALDTNQNAVNQFYKLQDSPAFVMNHGRQLSDKVKTAGTRQAGGQREDGLYIGSAKSAKQTVIYNKTKEIADESDKHYITAHHVANGLGGADVYRIELKLSNDVLKDYRRLFVNEDGEALSNHLMKRQTLEDMAVSTYQPVTAFLGTALDYTKFTNPAYLSSLFALFTNLDFRHKDNRHISRCTRFAFIDFNRYQKETIMQKIEYKDSMTNNFRIQKQSLETQIDLFKRTANPVLLEAAAAYAAEYRLQSHLAHLIKLYNIGDVVTAHLPVGYFDNTTIQHRMNLAL
ncbi:hypothetical protein ACFST9_08985 [Hymenobacter monticola]|uniref:Uncharacterized protein n=1 Tax=Hymenobacter monticola TaxID=1705399 RepID=A0ABY4BBI6_9BACT|nr:hypothetical protein [Hymenobacter monticola]UOE35657.1 hypothetical protein MTP16_08405 [Hymenobacter monticola]